MDFEYKIDNKLNILFVRFNGSLDDKRFIAAFNHMYAAPEYSPVMDQCLDYSAVEEFLLTSQGVEQLATLCENFTCLNTPWHTCIIAPHDLIFGYARMYQLLSDGSNEKVSVVRSHEAALRLMSLTVDTYPFQKKAVLHNDLLVR